MSVSVESIEFRVIPDESPDPSYLYQEDMGFEDRREQYENGDFGFVAVVAVAKLQVPVGNGDYVVKNEMRSPGLWGIESDSDEEYLMEIAEEEFGVLCDMLDQYGVGGQKAREARRSQAPNEHLVYV